MKQSVAEMLEAHLTKMHKDLGVARLAADIGVGRSVEVELKQAAEHIRNALNLVRAGFV